MRSLLPPCAAWWAMCQGRDLPAGHPRHNMFSLHRSKSFRTAAAQHGRTFLIYGIVIYGRHRGQPGPPAPAGNMRTNNPTATQVHRKGTRSQQRERSSLVGEWRVVVGRACGPVWVCGSPGVGCSGAVGVRLAGGSGGCSPRRALAAAADAGLGGTWAARGGGVTCGGVVGGGGSAIASPAGQAGSPGVAVLKGILKAF